MNEPLHWYLNDMGNNFHWIVICLTRTKADMGNKYIELNGMHAGIDTIHCNIFVSLHWCGQYTISERCLMMISSWIVQKIYCALHHSPNHLRNMMVYNILGQHAPFLYFHIFPIWYFDDKHGQNINKFAKRIR